MVTSAAIPTGAPIAATSPFNRFSSFAPGMLGSLGQQLMQASQPHFATPGGAAPMAQGFNLGVPGGGYGGLGGYGGMDPFQGLLGGHQLPGGGMPDYGRFGLLGHSLQSWLGPQSQAGWGMGTTTQSAAPGFFGRLFGG